MDYNEESNVLVTFKSNRTSFILDKRTLKIKGNDVRLSINIWEIQQNRYFMSSSYSL